MEKRVSMDDPNMVVEFHEQGGHEYVRIQALADKWCDVIQRVRPDHISRFPKEWAAYKDGKIDIEVEGTPLTECPGIDDNVALAWKLRGIRTLEELARLNEAAARAHGMGGLTQWQTAKAILELKQAQALLDITTEPKRGPGRPRKEDTTAQEAMVE